MLLLGVQVSPQTVDADWTKLQSLTREALTIARRSSENADHIAALVEELAEAHERFLQTNPSHVKAWLALAKLRVDQEKMAAADVAFGRAWSADPSWTGTGVAWATAWMNRDSARGIAVLDACIRADGSNLVLHTNRLRALGLFDPEGIATRFDAHVANSDEWSAAATMLDAMNRNDPAAAAAYLEGLVQVAPDHRDVIAVQARMRRSRNDFGTARQLMERLNDVDRDQPARAYLYSDTCYGEHDFDQANAVMQAIDLKPLESTAPGLHRRLKFLKPLRQKASDQWGPEQQVRLEDAAAGNNPIIVLVIDGQEVWCELFQDTAPNTVAAFLAIARSGFHDGRPTTYVHRGFRSIFGERTHADSPPDWTLPGEFDPATDRTHISGALCALREAPRPDSADTRFYVLHFPAPHLHGHRTNFGRVISGLDVIRTMDGSEILDEIRIMHPGSSTHVAEAILPDGSRVPLQSLFDASPLDTPARVNESPADN